uniref:Uncharacterized protein n=1 Tax=Anguilla anguilla TaxID=7936 RepID=A0A0E9WMQ7_ANGAN
MTSYIKLQNSHSHSNVVHFFIPVPNIYALTKYVFGKRKICRCHHSTESLVQSRMELLLEWIRLCDWVVLISGPVVTNPFPGRSTIL